MKIEVGKYYRTVGGEQVGPASGNGGGSYPFNIPHNSMFYGYTEDGKSCLNLYEDDIISEWVDNTTPPQTFLSAVEQLGLEYGMVVSYYEASDDGCTVSFEVDE